MSKHNFRRSQERYYSPHHRLLQISERALRQASASELGQELNVLTAITFSALGAEAFLNALGFRTNLEWKSFERRATAKKMEILCNYFNVPFDKAVDPWQTLECLIGLRNDIAHGKPEHLKTQKVMSEEDIERTRFNVPQSRLEMQLTLENSDRFVKATKNMIESFRKFVPQEIAFEIFQDGWSGSVSLT